MNQHELANAIREQCGWCERLGSPLYHALLLRIADDIESSGLCWKVLEPHSSDPPRSLLPLRFLGAIHRLVLEGQLPDLARFYPSVGGTLDPDQTWTAFLRALEQHAQHLSLPATVQTNEVARCCALLPGFLEIARSTPLPLRLLEIGCSAGLNLRWDRYRYETDRGAWGDGDSPVVFTNAFTNPPPEFDVPVSISERRGCDLNPIDPSTEDGRLTLLSFIWADQTERFHQISKAIDVARQVPASIARAGAIEWLESELATPRPGVATVVFHSIVMLYLDHDSRDAITRILAEAGARATAEAPLAWLSMEPGESETDVHLTLWPGAARRRIATAGYHGRNVLVSSCDLQPLTEPRP